ncbi:FAD-binding domain-containing protein [Artomyces pyxidatus]|uniref:FAD-binding domain-containing protein n=1 Tax=Artomyces pyxidatus TaxID=48021 RepID=A0ACB8T6U8_9AGAM|nr:FAD-binding domain-containing protein [Artomyces pyxidatus]
MSAMRAFFLIAVVGAHRCLSYRRDSSCRTQPGDPGFPSDALWDQLNEQVEGRLIPVVPSAEACKEVGCTPSQWHSGLYEADVPGSMNSYNWEQDYTSVPPSLCLYNYNGTACGQGRVPLYAINASSAADIQAGVNFASNHSLRVAIKSSGHDYLGRSTQKNSLLLWTQFLKDISFTDSFTVEELNLGSAVTVGSGVGLQALYDACKAQGKMVVGGSAATVSAGGGYVQGAGHSAFSPLLGLAADNALQFEVVIADGTLVTANGDSHPDLFWALRGGGAGSWGVVTAVTFRTYSTFNVTSHAADVTMASPDQAGAVLKAHATHIFDWDDVHAGQYFYLYNSPAPNITMTLWTLFPNTSAEDAIAKMAPFFNDARALGAIVSDERASTGLANDIIQRSGSDDTTGANVILGSRLIPASTYQSNQSLIGETYLALLEQGVQGILGHLVAGGKVSDDANPFSAIHPKWRTAKTHIIITQSWDDSTSPAQVEQLKEDLTNKHIPVLVAMTGETDSGSYSNEGDVREPAFQETFYGPNYQKLLSIKAAYDPNDLFIVGAGVGSERWDAEGLCRL